MTGSTLRRAGWIITALLIVGVLCAVPVLSAIRAIKAVRTFAASFVPVTFGAR